MPGSRAIVVGATFPSTRESWREAAMTITIRTFVRGGKKTLPQAQVDLSAPAHHNGAAWTAGAWSRPAAETRPVRERLGRATGRQVNRLTRDQIAALVKGLGDLLGVLATAAPEDKAEVYARLGLRLAYDPARRMVEVESHLDGDGGGPKG